jgi:putative transposase
MRNLNFAIEEFYHIYNRGIEKRKTFLDKDDYFRFTLLLYLSNGDRPVNMRETRTLGADFFGLSKIIQGDALVDIGAYCLMPNHFHILLRERVEGGISKFMLRVLTAYSMYFNRRYDRTGSLWEGVFKARHADTDEYLKYLFSYIHLNPVKIIQSNWKEEGIKDIIKTKNYLSKYKHSSFLDYLESGRHQAVILNKKEFPDYFSEDLNFQEDLIDWLKFDPDKLDFSITTKA